MIDFVLCDDQASHNQTLKLMIDSVLEKEKIEHRFACVASKAEEVLQYAQRHTEIAIYFLDICLDENDLNTPHGIDLCTQILEYSPKSCVIYVSAYQHYALSCCQSHAYDFLVKPFDENRLSDCLKAAIKYIEVEQPQKTLVVQAGSRTVNLDETDIRYIENKREYCIAYSSKGTTVWRESFAALMPRLSGDFVRIHRGYIINIKQVSEFNFGDDIVTIAADGTHLPIARRHKAELKMAIGGVNKI